MRDGSLFCFHYLFMLWVYPFVGDTMKQYEIIEDTEDETEAKRHVDLIVEGYKEILRFSNAHGKFIVLQKKSS